MADDFGSHLKHQRELRGISLDEISSITKIHLRYLEALESNSFDELPGEVFIKGFIRSYGRAIGANLQELISAYDETVGNERLETREQAQREDNSETQKQVFLVNAIVGGFLGLFILFAIWYLLQNPPKNDEPNKTLGNQQTASMSSTPAGTLDEIEHPDFSGESDSSGTLAEMQTEENADEIQPGNDEKTGDETGSDSESENANSDPALPLPQIAVAEKENSAIMENQKAQQVQEDSSESSAPQQVEAKLKLVIRVSENAWFNLSVDGAPNRDFILPAGETKEFKAQNMLLVTIGNRRGTELKLNGKKLSLPSTPDNVVRNFKVNLKLIE